MTYVKRASCFRLILRAAPAVGAIALTAALYGGPAQGADYLWPVTRVIDGDTVAVDASADLPPELARLRVRLRGIDTPEKNWRAKCPFEQEAGRRATVFTESQIDRARRNDRRIVVRNPKWGKYGGRVIADLVLDGQTLSALLIEAGHGRLYDGKRRKSWCPEHGM